MLSQVLEAAVRADPATSGVPPRALERNRYMLLDGMRGIAAVAVVLYHLAWQVGLERVLVPHAYLAVDFFFMLSGFVVADAYQRKLSQNTMSVGDFLKARLIRLYPMVLLAAAIAVPARLAQVACNLAQENLGTTLVYAAEGAALGPFHRTASGTIAFGFPLNDPLWSLFWELAANIIYALLAARVTPRRLVLVMAPFTIGLVALAFAHRGLNRGHADWIGGSIRIGFAFPAGILLWHVRSRMPAMAMPLPATVAVIVLVLAAPAPPGNAIYDLLSIVLIFPTLVLAGSVIGLAGAGLRAAAMLGAVSYPIYTLHYPFVPFVHLLRSAFRKFFLVPDLVSVLASVLSLSVLLVLGSYVALKWFDEPLRASLRRRFAAVAVARGQTIP